MSPNTMTSGHRSCVHTAWALLAICVAVMAKSCASTPVDPAAGQTTAIAISGRVVDEQGNGIFGATVTRIGPMNSGPDASTGVTDFTGSYQIRVPMGGPLTVAVQHVDYDFEPRVQTYAQATGDIEISFRGTARIAHSDSSLADGTIAVASAVDPARSQEDDAEARGGEIVSGAATDDAPAAAAERDRGEGSTKPTFHAAACSQPSDCADGQFCSGTERCLAGICISTGNPCPVGATCDEEADACRYPDASSWTPPVGIPEPSFGITETAPATPDAWDSGREGFYYVDQNHPNATDFLNSYGRPDHPRQSIPRFLTAGAVVELHGRYDRDHAGRGRLRAAGTREKPVFIRGSGNGVKPFITKRWEITGEYFILENLAFGDEDGDLSGGEVGRPNIIAPARYVALRHSDVSGNLTAGGVGVASWSAESCDNIVIYHNVIHDNGDTNANFDQDRHGISVLKRVSHSWLIDNEIYRNSGDGVQINGDSSTHHIYVGRNRAWQNKQTGFWCKTATDVVFSQNVAQDHKPSNSSPGAGMGWQYDSDRVWFLFNRIYRNTLGIRGASTNKGGADAVYLIGNVIHDLNGWAVEVWSRGPSIHIVNNTMFDTRGGIKGENSRAFYLSNNIIANTGDEPHVAMIGAVSSRSLIDHCLLFSRDGSIRVQWGSRFFNTVGALRGFMGQCADCIEADPQFADAVGRDFRLLPESPAVDAGAADDVYATFERLYGIDISSDFGAGARQEDQPFDIGAFEYLP